MKKLLLGALLLLSMFGFSQEPFVKKYNSLISIKNNVKQPWEKTDITVVFNSKGRREIVIYYSNSDKSITFYQIESPRTGKTKNGESYQIVECVDQDGEKVALQLFDDDTCLRILIAQGYYIEFHND